MPAPAVDAPAAAPPLKVPMWAVCTSAWAIAAIVGIARIAGVTDVPAVTTMGVIFTSIAVEALPFILVGAVVSAAIAVLVPDRAFAALGRLPRALQIPGAAVAGIGLPVCECGSVPVARRLLRRGVDPAAGVAFMLAAPVLNPLVLASTWVAYQGRGKALEMTAARAGLGLVIAITVAAAVTRLGSNQPLVTSAGTTEHEHEHQHDGDRLSAFADHIVEDFFFMAKFLVVGAAASALIQTVLPQQVLGGIGGAPIVAALSLAGLAVALSLCSEADAFVAVSFTAFPLSAQLAFLTVGPVLDFKLAALYAASFRRSFLSVLAVIAIPVAVVGSTILGGLM